MKSEQSPIFMRLRTDVRMKTPKWVPCRLGRNLTPLWIYLGTVVRPQGACPEGPFHFVAHFVQHFRPRCRTPHDPRFIRPIRPIRPITLGYFMLQTRAPGPPFARSTKFD